MPITSQINVQPQSFIFDNEKFCLPAPFTISGTFQTAPNTFAVTSLAEDPLNNRKVIATVAAGHNLNPNQPTFLTISGATQNEYNGYVRVEVVSPTVFTYWFAGTVTTPATGTVIADKGGCKATGTGTKAMSEFAQASGRAIWIYVAAQNALRQVVPNSIISDTQWEFYENFPSNVAAGTPLKVSTSGQYQSISVANTGGATGTYLEQDFAFTDPYVIAGTDNGLAPICGDATGTVFYVTVLKRLGQ